MTRSTAGRTRVDELYDAIRTDVLSGGLAPGERLKSTDLCERYGGSVSAVREALTRLVAQGLVCNEPHIGYSVVPLSRDDLEELTESRIDIEGLVLRRSILAGDLLWEQGVLATHHAVSKTPMFAEANPQLLSDNWARVHSDFHQALLAGCPNRRLLQIASDLRASSELYRRWSISLASTHHRDLDHEHEELCDLALARDADRAVAALTAHLEHTRNALITALDSGMTWSPERESNP